MKIMCRPGYHHNGLVATCALGHLVSHCWIAGINELKSVQQAKQGA